MNKNILAVITVIPSIVTFLLGLITIAMLNIFNSVGKLSIILTLVCATLLLVGMIFSMYKVFKDDLWNK
jgi:hypothetical protein